MPQVGPSPYNNMYQPYPAQPPPPTTTQSSSNINFLIQSFSFEFSFEFLFDFIMYDDYFDVSSAVDVKLNCRIQP